MKKKWLWVALVLSLAFNVFFAIGALRHRRERGGPNFEAHVREFADDLGLAPDQREAFFAWSEKFRADFAVFHTQREEDHKKLWAELVKADPDEAALQEFIDGGPGVEWRQRLVTRHLELVKLLQPDQKKKAAALILKRFRRHCPRSKREAADRPR